jgi:hypothetical protein
MSRLRKSFPNSQAHKIACVFNDFQGRAILTLELTGATAEGFSSSTARLLW